MSYFELWVILGNWKSEFSADDFANAFVSPDPRKVLCDMTNKGLLQRVGRGTYRVASPDRYIGTKYNVDDAYDILREAAAPYALTKIDGVFAWTRGGYNANRFFGSYPIYIRVNRSETGHWRRYLELRGKKSVEEGAEPRETLYGAYFVLVPVGEVEFDSLDGLKVEPLADTVRFCRDDPYTFGPALEILRKEFGVGSGAGHGGDRVPR